MFQALTHIMVGIILMFFDGIYGNLKDLGYFFMFFPFKAQAVYLPASRRKFIENSLPDAGSYSDNYFLQPYTKKL